MSCNTSSAEKTLQASKLRKLRAVVGSQTVPEEWFNVHHQPSQVISARNSGFGGHVHHRLIAHGWHHQRRGFPDVKLLGDLKSVNIGQIKNSSYLYMVISIRHDHIHHQPEVLYPRQQLPYHKTLSYVHLTVSTVRLILPHSPGKRSPPHTPEKRSADKIFVTQTVPPVSEYGIISQLAGQ